MLLYYVYRTFPAYPVKYVMSYQTSKKQKISIHTLILLYYNKLILINLKIVCLI